MTDLSNNGPRFKFYYLIEANQFEDPGWLIEPDHYTRNRSGLGLTKPKKNPTFHPLSDTRRPGNILRPPDLFTTGIIR